MTGSLDVLIIDDDRDMVESMEIILESKNYQVRSANSGAEGFRMIQERQPDLLILDVMMATETEGFDLAYKLNRHPEFRRIPILMVTGFPQRMAEDGPESFQHIMGEDWPVTKFLEKPIDPEVLLASIEEIAGSKVG